MKTENKNRIIVVVCMFVGVLLGTIASNSMFDKKEAQPIGEYGISNSMITYTTEEHGLYPTKVGTYYFVQKWIPFTKEELGDINERSVVIKNELIDRELVFFYDDIYNILKDSIKEKINEY